MLRTLPSSAQRRVPFRLRHRLDRRAQRPARRAAGVVAVVAWLATRIHHGTGKLQHPADDLAVNDAPGPAVPVLRARLRPARRQQGRAPQRGRAGDRRPARHEVDDRDLLRRQPRQGRGRVCTSPRVPATTARVIRIFTDTPGFSVQIYARNNKPPLGWPDAGWRLVGNRVARQAQTGHHADLRRRRGTATT